ncbi:hypothetical protein [Lacrimispora sp.]
MRTGLSVSKELLPDRRRIEAAAFCGKQSGNADWFIRLCIF